MFGFGLKGDDRVRDAGFVVVSCPSQDLARTNRIFVSEPDFVSRFAHSKDARAGHALLNECFVYIVQPLASITDGSVALNSVQRKELRLALGDATSLVPFSWPAGHAAHSVFAASFEVEPVAKNRVSAERPLELEDDLLRSVLMRSAKGAVLNVGQSLIIDALGTAVLLRVASLVAEGQSVSRAELRSDTAQLYFARAAGAPVRILGGNASNDGAGGGSQQARQIFRADFEFEKLGIGGLDNEFSQIFRRAFASRVFPPAVINQLGISHVKGMLLYGPPGTGKTLIARQIGKMLNAREPKVVNGPEILNKYVGQSEENIRELFADAEKDYLQNGEHAELHIIIFDEIDAICKKRGSGRDSTGVQDTVVNQLLSKIDGVNALNNILVIGMTNRKDMIDDALLRPGRLEVHVEISLPDEEGRCQILAIHTSKMRTNKMLASDVSLTDLAARTQNYSGAELEGVCKSAAGFALNRKVDYRKLQESTAAIGADGGKGVIVEARDFDAALLEVQPAFGMGAERIEKCLLGGFLLHGHRLRSLLHSGQLFVDEVQRSRRNPLMSVLIEGPDGTGKTALAAKLAMESQFPFVRFVSPEDYVGYGEASKCAALAQAFDDAHKSELSVLVLDNLERMIEYAPIGPRFSNLLLQSIMVLVKTLPPHGRRLLILATTSCAEVLQSLQLAQCFNAVLSTQPLIEEEVACILQGNAKVLSLNRSAVSGVTSLQESTFDQFRFSSESECNRSTHLLASQNLGIKKFLMLLELASQGSEDDAKSKILTYQKIEESLRSIR
mmetsp:Transcript_12649/g.22783  ORF Transcript_12649/g.22783 Transcript_12649/m.22783 type:complete len:785 (-) Transcript_12649:37-2391(-)